MFGCWHQEEVLEVREGHDFARIFVVSVIEYSSVECHQYVDDEEYVHHCPVVHRHCASLHAEGVALLQAERVRSCVSVRVGVQKCVCVCVCVCSCSVGNSLAAYARSGAHDPQARSPTSKGRVGRAMQPSSSQKRATIGGVNTVRIHPSIKVIRGQRSFWTTCLNPRRVV